MMLVTVNDNALQLLSSWMMVALIIIACDVHVMIVKPGSVQLHVIGVLPFQPRVYNVGRQIFVFNYF